MRVDNIAIGEIGQGLLLLAGFGRQDDNKGLTRMAERVRGLRIFSDENGRFQYSVSDIGGEILVVPQFTLYGDAGKGRRPDFSRAMNPELATLLFNQFVHELRRESIGSVQTGKFGADMQVTLTNDGPVTLMLES